MKNINILSYKKLNTLPQYYKFKGFGEAKQPVSLLEMCDCDIRRDIHIKIMVSTK